MASEPGSPLLAFIRRVAGARTHGELTDGDLLQRFAVGREEAAFLALLQRHGPMVLGVCQSILHDAHDAEDAFQATFLVLVRKPGAIGKPASLASWLHGVACRLALRARAEAARRRLRERQVVPMPGKEPHDEVVWRDLRPVLHEEVDRLPERYRLPFVLCYLEGKTNEEAADLLGWPKGTVLSSLSRARERLRRRLTRRGLTLTGGVLTALAAQNAAQAAVPAALAEGTLKAALLFAAGPAAVGGIAAPVLAYAEGALHAAFVVKLKLVAVVLLAAAAGTGAGVLAFRGRPTAPEAPGPEARRPVEDKDALQGTWRIVAAEQQGQQIDRLNGRRLIFRGDHFSLNAGPGEVGGIIPTGQMDGEFKLEAANPARIDLTRRSGYLRGVYSLEGNRLLVCLSGVDDRERPGGLSTKPGSKQLLLNLERE
jgi:RNA polymerase sigma factor (sigma-70 family)